MDESEPTADGEKLDEEAGEAKIDIPDADKNKAEDHGGSENVEGATGAEAPSSERRGKTLEQMMSLKDGDDERTLISKKISWILRHGAQKVNIEIDNDGWVTFESLLGSTVMAGVTEDKLMDVIEESNVQKVRYELKEPDEESGSKAIRAVSKHTISGMSVTLSKEQRREEREKRREARQEQREQERNGMMLEGDGAAAFSDVADQSRGGGHAGADNEDDLTFEQQLKEGYKPLYQGNRVVAMVKEGGETVAPGRRTKGEYKGKGYGKDTVARYGSDYENYSGYGSKGGYGSYGGYGKGGGGDYGGYGDDGRGRSDFWFQKGGGGGKGGYRDRGDYGKYGGGKGYDDGGRNYGKYGGGKSYDGKYGGGGKGYDDGYYTYSRWSMPTYESSSQYWRVCNGQQAIMRETEAMESQAIITLPAGALVLQTGAEVTNEHGIVRMPVETVDDRVRGWVTRTAEAAQGPAFFKPDSGPGKGSDSRGAGKGSKGKGSGKSYFDSGGKGK